MTSHGPGRIAKPTVFISHAVTDEPIAAILKAEIDRVFARGVTVFASSIPGAVRPGSDWLRSIRENLDAASAVVVLITPVSINRPWIWFEVGASWSRMEVDEGRIYPLCVPEIDLADLPEPLSRLQALSLGKAEHIRLFFSALTQQFGFGNMKGFKGSTIKAKLPRYPTLKVADSDIRSGTLYTGPYEGYSADELREVLVDEFFRPEFQRFRSYRGDRHGGNVFTQKLIHYREVDDELRLPPGRRSGTSSKSRGTGGTLLPRRAGRTAFASSSQNPMTRRKRNSVIAAAIQETFPHAGAGGSCAASTH